MGRQTTEKARPDGHAVKRYIAPRGRDGMLAVLLLSLLYGTGCQPLSPRAIDAARIYDSPHLLDEQPQIQRGQPRPVIDGFGWVWGIPSKLLLWNRRVENHRIGFETEVAITDYLAANQLPTVRVRLNQYRPGEDWRRLVRNKSVGAGWRYTVGALSVLGETLVPGRLFGGDHYNPFTNTIHLYSDVPAIALHEGAHAKDFARRYWKGTYGVVYALPIVPLYHESVASRDVVAYLETHGTPQQQAAAQRILMPAYGTYVGNAAGYAAPAYAFPLYYGAVLLGHVWGKRTADQILQSAAVEPISYANAIPSAAVQGAGFSASPAAPLQTSREDRISTSPLDVRPALD